MIHSFLLTLKGNPKHFLWPINLAWARLKLLCPRTCSCSCWCCSSIPFFCSLFSFAILSWNLDAFAWRTSRLCYAFRSLAEHPAMYHALGLYLMYFLSSLSTRWYAVPMNKLQGHWLFWTADPWRIFICSMSLHNNIDIMANLDPSLDLLLLSVILLWVHFLTTIGPVKCGQDLAEWVLHKHLFKYRKKRRK